MFMGDGAWRDMFISLHPEDIRAQLSWQGDVGLSFVHHSPGRRRETERRADRGAETHAAHAREKTRTRASTQPQEPAACSLCFLSPSRLCLLSLWVVTGGSCFNHKLDSAKRFPAVVLKN